MGYTQAATAPVCGACYVGPPLSLPSHTLPPVAEGAVYQLSLGLVGIPDGNELLTIDVVDGKIFDTAGNAPLSDLQTVRLVENVRPTYTLALSANNSVWLSFSENVTQSNSSVRVDALQITLSGGSANLGTPSLVPFSGSLYRLELDLSGPADGSEILTVGMLPDLVVDEAGKAAKG